MRPVYVLLEPAISSPYQWERWPVEDDEDEYEEPVLLEVDACGLTLLPDLATLEIPHYVWVRPEGHRLVGTRQLLEAYGRSHSRSAGVRSLR